MRDWFWFLKRKCRHKNKSGLRMHGLEIGEFTVVSSEPAGVTFDWGGNLTVYHKSTLKCGLCGEEFDNSGIRFRDNWPKDETGWPVNKDGTRMELASHLTPHSLT